ncbi:MAG: hypothetical protein COX57_04150 [Alphaproteobacteria bacterium CG_4_10_14_0_2_um_filter_63_37]|nr:MAG: hypothetical protein AUJ55_01440 [Proteobacteria bacterium CG1_02_64_396]PJA25235.1 MAG: hypothetical protein COX57_04150 [Alphaproteobacteria bacterium CG_4_10_14_0_2_um_filter_63_37]
MKLTTKGRYAVSALVDLACRSSDRPVSLAEIATSQSISISYLEQLFGKMRRQKLVKSVRGPGGGYTLAQNPSLVTVAEIIRAVDEPIRTTSCEAGGEGGCRDGERCNAHALWMSLSERIYDYLEHVTLQDVLDESFPAVELYHPFNAQKELAAAEHNAAR